MLVYIMNFKIWLLECAMETIGIKNVCMLLTRANSDNGKQAGGSNVHTLVLCHVMKYFITIAVCSIVTFVGHPGLGL